MNDITKLVSPITKSWVQMQEEKGYQKERVDYKIIGIKGTYLVRDSKRD